MTRSPSHKGALAAIACVAVIVIGFSGWSLSEYVQGRDPLAPLSSIDLFQTVAVDEPSAESDAVSVVGPESLAATEEVSETDESAETESVDTSDASGSSSGGRNRKEASAADGGDDVGDTSADGASVSTQVHVTLSASASATGGSSSSASLTLEAGSTVYDALAASGIPYNARGTSMGVYVSSILGVAEMEHGGGSGWTYTVNGVMPTITCSSYELSDGDVVRWTYVNVEY